MNKSGVANTITSVQKDSMVAEPRIIEVGRVKEGKHQQDNVQHEDGICRCICTGHHASTPHLLKTMVGEPIIFDDYNQRIPNDQDCIGTLTTNIGSSTPRNGIKLIEPQVLTPKRTEFGKTIRKQYEAHEVDMSRHDMTTMEPRTDGVTNTLTSVQKDNYLAIPEATSKGYAEAHEGDSVNLTAPNSQTRRGRVGNQMANPLDTGCQQGVVTPNYRIRKLTVREVFRLMGVEDADIDKLLSAGISNSQLYKCAGNSIVVDNLYHIMRKMFVDKGCDDEVHQQSLF